MRKKDVISVLLILLLCIGTAVCVWSARYEDFDVTKLRIAGREITATAAELNKLDGLTGDVLSTTNSKTVSGKTLSGLTVTIAATHTFTTLTDWVLSASEALCTLLVTDSGSGGANIVEAGGVAGRIKIVRNAGTGTVTIKESGQSGVSVALGKTAVVIHNGTDYIRVTADATH